MRMQINRNDIVAGAAADGYGVILGWQGYRPLTRADLTLLSIKSHLPTSLLPDAKEPAVQLTRAVQSVAGVLYNAEQIKKSTWNADVEPREWSSRWVLVTRATGAVIAGQPFGAIALVVTLYTDGPVPELAFDVTPELTALADDVRNAFDARIGAEIYVASDVTSWLASVLLNHFDAVRLGGNWYVPQRFRAEAEMVCEVFSEAWGRGWMQPIPVATSAQIARGVSNGLVEECGVIAADITKARAAAIEDGREDISERAAKTLMLRLRFVSTRVAKHLETIGDDGAEWVRTAIRDAMIALESVLGAVDFAAEWDAAGAAASSTATQPEAS